MNKEEYTTEMLILENIKDYYDRMQFNWTLMEIRALPEWKEIDDRR